MKILTEDDVGLLKPILNSALEKQGVEASCFVETEYRDAITIFSIAGFVWHQLNHSSGMQFAVKAFGPYAEEAERYVLSSFFVNLGDGSDLYLPRLFEQADEIQAIAALGLSMALRIDFDIYFPDCGERGVHSHDGGMILSGVSASFLNDIVNLGMAKKVESSSC